MTVQYEVTFLTPITVILTEPKPLPPERIIESARFKLIAAKHSLSPKPSDFALQSIVTRPLS